MMGKKLETTLMRLCRVKGLGFTLESAAFAFTGAHRVVDRCVQSLLFLGT